MPGGFRKLLSNPAVQSGIALGAVAAIRTYQPSLVDRSRNDQALIVAGSLLTGYVAGNLIERVLGPIGPAALGAVAQRHSPVNGALAAVGGSAAGLMALRRQLRSYPRDGKPAPAPKDVAASLAAGAGGAAAAWTVLAAERAVAGRLADAVGSRSGGRRLLWIAASHIALTAGASIAARFAASKVLYALDAASDRIETSYADPPTSSFLSGGPGSVVEFTDLSQAGRRMIAEAATAAAINRVMGIDNAVDPIRIYVGIDSASSVAARVALAIAEVRRTRALDRSLVVVGSPSGSGYLNYITIEAAEYLTAGDVATITIQYGKRPSLLSIDRIDLAQRQHRALVDAIASELGWRAPEDRPRLVLYGESLGAQTSQDAFSVPGVDTLNDRFVDRALWVGTPHPTRFRRAVLSANPVDRRFGRAASIADHDPATHYTFLDHHEDPVTLFTPSIFYRRPPWLGAPATRPPNVSHTQRWVPGVTFWQTAIDTKNAAAVVPGEFNAFGHDYRADLAEFVRAAYGIEGITDGQMESVERALRRSEIERSRRIAGA